jgi:hypothetical protein
VHPVPAGHKGAGPSEPLYQCYRTALCRLPSQSSLFDEVRSNGTVHDMFPVHTQIRVTHCIHRPTSRLWFVDLITGQKVTSIVVKCGTLVAATPHQRLPRLTPTVPAPQMISRQAQALQAINCEFAALSDPRFLAVRVLMLDAGRRILAMNRFPGDELLSRLHAAARPTGLTARRDLPVFQKWSVSGCAIFTIE